MRGSLRFALLCIAVCQLVAGLSVAQSAPHSQPPAPAAFTEKTASEMLLQLSEALESHSQKRFLALFDLPQMKGGGLFKQQVNLFFSQTESIRVHLNLVETTNEQESATMSVDAELDAQPINGSAWRKNERLTFAVASVGGSWKFVDVQSRSFFSLP